MKISKQGVIFLVIVGIAIAAVSLSGIINSRRDEEDELRKDTLRSKQNLENLVIEEEKISDNLPKDFPIYPNAKLESAYSSKGEEVEATSVIWRTKGSVEEIGDYYKTQLKSSGWQLKDETEELETVTFSFERGDTIGFLGLGKEDSDNVFISVTLGANRELPSL